MAQRKGAIKEVISEESLPFIQKIACMQMNLSDAYYFLSGYYMDDVAVAGVAAYIQDQPALKWYHAKESMRYIISRGNKVCLPDIQRPQLDHQRCIDCLTTVLCMEKELTEVLRRLYDTAFNTGDTDLIFPTNHEALTFESSACSGEVPGHWCVEDRNPVKK
ncbi:ferritin, mitochondrial-like [Peromyscus leucopus]|uniref:ferritin, mitochondrial-like n=1 Tax=Peromyscus leucopus TaxID=10041 RepID=UPI0010A19C4D|nr:ferritin, mitochondrial-like [Peromyscus leucopus]